MTRIAVALLAAVLTGFAATPAAAQEGGPVVVELYTSEGCSSCPAADAYLFELRERDDVLALAFHVDYWDYLGWQDRFARPDFTQRQRGYNRALGSPMVYTPQLIVGGADHVVGSNRAAVEDAIARAAERPRLVDIGMAWAGDGSLVVTIPGAGAPARATIWFVRYAEGGETEVTSGENAGMVLRHANVVEEVAALGMWDGRPMEIVLPREAIVGDRDGDSFGCAILIQAEGLGPILGAREIDWGGAS